jgi:hypothetical protein
MAVPDAPIGHLNSGDFTRSLIVGALTTGFATAASAFLGGGVSWPVVGVAFVSGVFGYITKNLGTNNKGKFLGIVG